jgi:hypothetical protein
MRWGVNSTIEPSLLTTEVNLDISAPLEKCSVNFPGGVNPVLNLSLIITMFENNASTPGGSTLLRVDC